MPYETTELKKEKPCGWGCSSVMEYMLGMCEDIPSTKNKKKRKSQIADAGVG